jgi:hypothetical protein
MRDGALLDTCTFIWLVTDSLRLADRARDALRNGVTAYFRRPGGPIHRRYGDGV